MAPNDTDAIATVLRQRVESYQRGERPTRVAAGGRFSRSEQAALLLDAVGQIASAPAGRAP